MRNLLGGKGCELAEMTNLGIPVPPGFTITTQAWAHYNRSGHQFPDGLWEQVSASLATVEGLAARTNTPRFAWDCYRRFITMFGNVVLGIRREAFDEHLDALKAQL